MKKKSALSVHLCKLEQKRENHYMKAYILGIFLLCILSTTQAQYIETFNNISFSPSNTWSSALPSGMSSYNLDGLQPASQIATAFPNNEAWVIHIADNDTFAASHSWYNPSGTSNDWLVTPTISVPQATATETPFLIWETQAPDINFSDGYLVKVSTNGNQPNDFLPAPIFEESNAPNTFTIRAIPLANFAGQNIHIAFINNSYDKFMLYIDDIKVKNLPTQPDISLEKSYAKRIAETNEDVFMSGSITNHSAVTITDVTITWTTGGQNNDMFLSGLNIPPLQSYHFIHTIPFHASNVDENQIALSVTSINNTQDVNPTNNTQYLKISTVSQELPKAVVFEEVTGTWCGWCPRGIVSMHYMDSLYANTGQFIGIAIHTQDTMAIDDYADSTKIHLIPRTNVDRMLFDQETNPAAYQAYFDEQSNLPTPASLSTLAFYQNQQVSVQVNAQFVTKISSGLRFAVILVEDNVHSEHSSFDQVNLYYYYGSQNPMGGFENLPDPVPASEMWYNHVARALLGGYHGEINSIPSVVYEGNTASYTFYYNLPYYINPNNTKAVAILLDEETGRIYNAQSVPLMYGSLAIESLEQPELTVFPNPASDVLNLRFETSTNQDISVSLYNSIGQMVSCNLFSNCMGEQQRSLCLEGISTGTYLLSFSMEGKSFWRNILITK